MMLRSTSSPTYSYFSPSSLLFSPKVRLFLVFLCVLLVLSSLYLWYSNQNAETQFLKLQVKLLEKQIYAQARRDHDQEEKQSEKELSRKGFKAEEDMRGYDAWVKSMKLPGHPNANERRDEEEEMEEVLELRRKAKERAAVVNARVGEELYHGDTVHVMLVGAEITGNERRVTELQCFLNSLFYFRTCPIHIHAFVDNDMRNALQEHFSKNRQAKFSVDFYDVNAALGDFCQIQDDFWKGSKVKACVADILTEVDHVLTLDTDALVLDDIAKFWEVVVNNFTDGQGIGLVKEFNWWYHLHPFFNANPEVANDKPYVHNAWGFNGGIGGFNLKLLREVGWNSLWKEKMGNIGQPLNLGDQDIYTYMYRWRPDLYYVLPPSWNVQLAWWDPSHWDRNELTEVNLIHGNFGRLWEHHRFFLELFKDIEVDSHFSHEPKNWKDYARRSAKYWMEMRIRNIYPGNFKFPHIIGPDGKELFY